MNANETANISEYTFKKGQALELVNGSLRIAVLRTDAIHVGWGVVFFSGIFDANLVIGLTKIVSKDIAIIHP